MSRGLLICWTWLYPEFMTLRFKCYHHLKNFLKASFILMRILLLNYEYPPIGGGAGNAAFHIGRELAEMGDEIIVLTSGFKGLQKTESKERTRIIRVPAWRKYRNKSNPVQMTLYILSCSWHLLLHGKKLRPDVAVAFLGIPSGPPALFLKILYGQPYIK